MNASRVFASRALTFEALVVGLEVGLEVVGARLRLPEQRVGDADLTLASPRATRVRHVEHVRRAPHVTVVHLDAPANMWA